MKSNLLNILFTISFLQVAPNLFCQENKTVSNPESDKIIQISEQDRISILLNEFNGRVPVNDKPKLNFLSEVTLNPGLKIQLIELVSNYKDRIFSINFNNNEVNLTTSGDLSAAELYGLFHDKGFRLNYLDENNAETRFYNGIEVKIQKK